MLLNIKTDFDLIRVIQFYATEPFREDQFIHCQNTISLIHVNTDNDNSFSLFDRLLNVLILTFSVCGISHYRWTTAMDFTYRVPLYIYNMPCVLFYQ